MLQPHRILVYKTASWVYLVGSRKAEDAWRILKLGRQEMGLVVEEDPTIYTRLQLTQLLQTLRDGTRRWREGSGGTRIGPGWWVGYSERAALSVCGVPNVNRVHV